MNNSFNNHINNSYINELNLNYATIIDNITNFKNKLKIYKQNLKIKLQTYDIDNFNKEQTQLVTDMCNQIINSTLNGESSTIFDLQYTNPCKEYYKPGPPLLQLDLNSYSWFNEYGFTINQISDCYNKSTNCDFACNGDGICRINFSWNNVNQEIKYSKDVFSASTCKLISSQISKFTNII
jgi:hypothetical protein